MVRLARLFLLVIWLIVLLILSTAFITIRSILRFVWLGVLGASTLVLTLLLVELLRVVIAVVVASIVVLFALIVGWLLV